MVNAVAQQIARQAENLRLFSEAEKYRDEAEDAIQRLTRENWEVYESRISTFGYEYDQDMVHPLGQFDEAEDEAVSLTRDIKIHGESIGSLEVCDLDPDSGQAEALMDTVSSVLSAHIENLRLSEQTELALADSQKRGADLDLINRVVSIATESLDMEYTLQSIADELGTALGYDRVSISLIDVPRNSFTIMAEYVSGMVEKKTRGMTFSLDGDAFIPEVMRTKNPLTTANIKNTPSTSPAFEMVRAMNMDMFAMFPMIVGQDVVGTVSVASKETGRVLTDDEIVLLQTMIRQIATAVQNARLFTQTEQRARRDQILNEITARVYTAVDADSILQTAAKEIHRQLGFEAFVYLDDSAELEAQPDNGNNGQA